MLTVAAPASSAVSANSKGSFIVEVRGHSLPEPPLPSGRWRLRGWGSGQAKALLLLLFHSDLVSVPGQSDQLQSAPPVRATIRPSARALKSRTLRSRSPAISTRPPFPPCFSPGCFWEFAFTEPYHLPPRDARAPLLPLLTHSHAPSLLPLSVEGRMFRMATLPGLGVWLKGGGGGGVCACA